MNKISTLSNRLKSQIQSDRAALEKQTNELLQQHSASLNQLSSDALRTTRSAMRQQTAQIKKTLWLIVLMPLSATLLLCGLAVLVTYLMLPVELFQTRTETVKLSSGQIALMIISDGWTTCQDTQKQPRPCRIKN